MLLGTGALAGIIANSGMKDVLIEGLKHSGLPSYILARAVRIKGLFNTSIIAPRVIRAILDT